MTSSTTPAGPTYVARGPVDLIALVPFVLGFHPTESVVLLTFGSPHGAFHARVDLPCTDRGRDEVVSTLCAAVTTNRARSVVVLVFSSDHAAARRISAELVPALLRADAEVIDAVRADGRRWWCVGPGEPPEAGPGHPYDLSTHPFTAEQVLEGRAAFTDRESLAASLLPARTAVALADRGEVARAADLVADALLAGPHAAGSSAQWLLAQITRSTGPGPEPSSAADAARLGLLVQVAEMRDVVGTTLARDTAPTQVALWRDLLVRMPDELVPGVAAVLALAAWLAGDGALAWCAIERCEQCAPDDASGARAGLGLARDVARRLQGAHPPSAWRPVRAATVRVLRPEARRY